MNSSAIIELCLSKGFALAGITKAIRSSYDSEFEQWLANGKQGEMQWMNRNVEVRLDPRTLLEGAQSVIAVADRYGVLTEEPLAKGHGKVARYARGKDYHKVMKRRIHSICDELRVHYPDETFRGCVDTAPVLEREFAAKAGLGAIGKHTLLIEQSVGSWILLGVIVTTAKLEAVCADEQDPCATCTRCIDACPTDAITPWSVDARKCISYLTIEHRSEIESTFFTDIGEWLFGCDICQEVCPHNQPTEKGTNAPLNEVYSPRVHSLEVLDVLQWDENARQKACSGSSMKRAKLGMMRRNAVIVAGNMIQHEDNEELHSALKLIASSDTDEMVRNTAIAVLEQRQGT